MEVLFVGEEEECWSWSLRGESLGMDGADGGA